MNSHAFSTFQSKTWRQNVNQFFHPLVIWLGGQNRRFYLLPTQWPAASINLNQELEQTILQLCCSGRFWVITKDMFIYRPYCLIRILFLIRISWFRFDTHICCLAYQEGSNSKLYNKSKCLYIYINVHKTKADVHIYALMFKHLQV